MEDNERKLHAEYLLKDLYKNKNKEVLLVICDKGNREEYYGILDNVTDNSVSISGKEYYYITKESAIIGIRLQDGDVLYYNPYIDATYGSKSEEENYNNYVEIAKLMFGEEKASELTDTNNDVVMK